MLMRVPPALPGTVTARVFVGMGTAVAVRVVVVVVVRVTVIVIVIVTVTVTVTVIVMGMGTVTGVRRDAPRIRRLRIGQRVLALHQEPHRRNAAPEDAFGRNARRRPRQRGQAVPERLRGRAQVEQGAEQHVARNAAGHVDVKMLHDLRPSIRVPSRPPGAPATETGLAVHTLQGRGRTAS